MKSRTILLLLGALLVPLGLLVQSGGSGAQQQGGTQQEQLGTQPLVQVQPLGQGYVLQGQQDQTQQQTETQQQGGTGTQQPLQTQTGTQQQTQTQTEQASGQATEQASGQSTTELATAPTPEVESVPQDATGVHLEGLDKITARTFAFEAPLDKTVRFGYLEITARRCVVASEADTPERSAFLEVVEHKPGIDPVNVFSGWMFASSPSVSAMEHPVYDIWVVDCSGYEGEPTATAATGDGTTPEQVEAPVEGVERPLD